MSSGTRRPTAGIEVERDDAERLSADDMATRREEEFLAIALEDQQRSHQAAAQRHRPGVCTNCLEPCLPTAVYCDEDCRDDHEKRQAAERRTGAGWGTGGIQP